MTVKQAVLNLARSLPEECTWDEVRDRSSSNALWKICLRAMPILKRSLLAWEPNSLGRFSTPWRGLRASPEPGFALGASSGCAS